MGRGRQDSGVGPSRSVAALRIVLGSCVLLGFSASTARAERCPTPDEAFAGRTTRASFLAVGDFGQPPGWIPLFDPRRAVAAGINEAHRCHPADALFLLGDNFYPHGLDDENFEPRIRDTLVRPFCRFLSLSGEHGESLASDCPLDAGARTPVPILAVMGNHDYEPPVDGRLEKHVLPDWIPEWRMPRGTAEVFELDGGVSLIAIDSVRLHEGASFAELVSALEVSHGPWRILIAHHPLTRGGEPWEERYATEVSRAIEQSGRVVQLMLAGHEHYLAVSPMDSRTLPLQAVVGSGARVREASHQLLGDARRWPEFGFARIDLLAPMSDAPEGQGRVEEESEETLQLTLFATPSTRASFWSQTRSVVRFSVMRDGRLREVAP